MVAIGVMLVLAGFCVRIIAMRSLKGMFSLYLVPRSAIVTGGIYSKIRHPSYTGTMIVLVGLAMIDIRLCIAYHIFITFLMRAMQEEQIMSINPYYKGYMETTKRFIPYIL